MNKQKLYFIFFLLLGIILQLFFIPYFNIYNMTPDIITIIVIHSSFYFGQMYGTGYGFLSGLTFDLVSGGMMGSGMFAKTLTGFIAGFFQNSYFADTEMHFIRYLITMLFCSAIDSFFYSLFGSAEIKLNLISIFFNSSLLPALYTTVLSIPFYFFKQKSFLNE